MRVRKIEDEDFEEISKWCKHWRFPEMASISSALPPDGFIVEDEDQPIICGWIYLTNSIFAHPEWIVSNFAYKNKVKRKLALKMLFEKFEQFAKEKGHGMFLMGTKQPFFIKQLMEIGFTETDKNITHLIKKI